LIKRGAIRIMKARHLCLLAPLALALSACSSDDDRDFDAAAEARATERAANPAPVALFSPDPADPRLPFPYDLFFAGAEPGDFTLNVPIAGADENPELANDLANPSVALNLSDGFSTTAPITTPLSTSLDPASLRIGETIRVFELTTDATGTPTGLGDELDASRLVATERDNQLALVPITPLTPATRHAVFLTNGIVGMDGRPLAADSTFRLLRAGTRLFDAEDPTVGQSLEALNPALIPPARAQLEPLRLATRPLIELVQAASGAPAVQDVALAWTFTTQGTTEVLDAVAAASTARSLVVSPTGATTMNVGGRGAADLFVGRLELPYYQVPVIPPTDGSDSGPGEYLAAINGFWIPASGNGEVVTRFDPMPNLRSDLFVPVLMSVPNDGSGMAMPETGWPVMIFQHGITQNRGNMLAVADAMASAGFVVVAIDMPMHGIVADDDPLATFRIGGAESERSFGIDLLTQDARGATTAAAPDGVPDSSGAHFYNLRNLVNSRDNLRQAVADLLTLSKSLGTVEVAGEDNAVTPFPIDTDRIAFMGHSLGGIVGTTFLAFDDNVKSATLAMPGGGIAQLLAGSPSFGPTIRAGVDGAEGVSDAEYQQFLGIVQTLVDSGDPINHAGTVAAGDIALHFIEVVGEDGASPPDLVVPNAVAGAPLAGSEPLARALGLEPIVESATAGALVRFSRGTHGSIIDPAADPSPDGVATTEAELATAGAVTVEMQTQAATFAASRGTMLPIGDADVIAPLDVTIVPVMLPTSAVSGDVEAPAGARR